MSEYKVTLAVKADNEKEALKIAENLIAEALKEAGTLANVVSVDEVREYGKVVWLSEDVKDIRAHWPIERCEEALAGIEGEIMEHLISLGWDHMDRILPGTKVYPDEIYDNTINGVGITRAEVFGEGKNWHWKIIDVNGRDHLDKGTYETEDMALKGLMEAFDKKED